MPITVVIQPLLTSFVVSNNDLDFFIVLEASVLIGEEIAVVTAILVERVSVLVDHLQPCRTVIHENIDLLGATGESDLYLFEEKAFDL